MVLLGHTAMLVKHNQKRLTARTTVALEVFQKDYSISCLYFLKWIK